MENELKLILAGKIVDAELNFTFEVWASEKMPEQDLNSAFREYLARHDSHTERESLRGTVVRRLIQPALPSPVLETAGV